MATTAKSKSRSLLVIAMPIPPLAPVTNATLPFQRFILVVIIFVELQKLKTYFKISIVDVMLCQYHSILFMVNLYSYYHYSGKLVCLLARAITLATASTGVWLRLPPVEDLKRRRDFLPNRNIIYRNVVHVISRSRPVGHRRKN